MSVHPKMHPLKALSVWRTVMAETVRTDDIDLSTRQIAILLTVYLSPPPHTV